MRPGRSRRIRSAVAAAAACAVVVGLVVASPAAQARPTAPYTPGAPGVGDPYFPLEGNGGYDVGHYTLDLTYHPDSHLLAGTDTITATATQNLSRFDLDLSGMTVAAISVNGAAATWTRAGQELQITPRSGLPSGRSFTVAVRYSGVPKTIVGSPIVFGADYGWQYTKDGAFVGDEPDASRTWYPSNDHPSDKATFTYRITVPSDRQVVANGDLVSQHTTGAATTFVYDETSPMATYLATIDIGRWKFRTGRTPGGIRELMAYDPALGAEINGQDVFGLTGRVTDYWAKTFGPVRVHFDRRHRRRRARRRVLAGDADPSALRFRPRSVHAVARTVAPVVRRQRLGADLARHLAQRGFRYVQHVPVG